MSVQKFISKDGASIACFKSGSGAPLVLVHGTAADHTRWAPVLSGLEKRFTVYACDRRGRGASGDAPAYSIEGEFDDVAAVIDGIGEPVDVLGHSHGAICSLEAATRARNLRRLVLYEPPIPAGVAIYPPGMIDRLQGRLDAGDRDGVVSTFMAEVVRVPPDQLALMKSLPAWPSRVSAAHTIVRELRAQEQYSLDASRVQGVHVPTLLLLGEASPPFFGAALERIHAALPQSRRVVLPRQTHVAMDTAPDLFLREVLTFLQ
jgi:pimeloyl-ACP methyl ester carboxylesterase